MCGIAGISLRPGQSVEPAVLDRLARALAHRGPDGAGRQLRGGVALVHTRLAIIDLKTGDQPLEDDAGAALIANGEIYNSPELRAALAGPFRTASDCEPPLALYREAGEGFAARLRGMWGIALHDTASGDLYLSRDPFGIKQLYYAETPAGLAFASEPQALIAAGFVAPEVNIRARDELLALQFTTGAETIYRGIYRVLPGETLTVRAGKVVGREHRVALPEGPPEPVDEAMALKRLDDAILDSVMVHQRADVPYGMFLSGGVDSSALLVAMARLNDRPVRAFTAGFDEPGVPDERPHAAAVAKSLGAEHIEVAFGAEDFWSTLPAVVAALDDPVIDYATLPTFKLAATAGADLKVVLCGEGGDEMFGGYGRYRRAIRPWWQGGARPMRARAALAGAGVLRMESASWRNGIAQAEAAAATGGRTALQTAQATDCADWLPHDLLIKLDRCLMAHGVEGRTPFLDPAVAAAAFRLPDRLKVRGRLGKWLLRRWLDARLPEAGAFARKRGFTVPVGAWIARRADEIGPLVAAQPGIAELCKPEAVRALYGDAERARSGAAWMLLFYALWHNHHVLGLPTEGDIAASLAAS